MHLEPATVALTGAAAMLLVSRQSIEESLGGIEWATLFFFLGLFVMVGALDVLPTDVENAADRRPVSQRAVRPLTVVVADEACQGPRSSL